MFSQDINPNELISVSSECFSELMLMLYEKGKRPQMLKETSWSLQILHHTHTHTHGQIIFDAGLSEFLFLCLFGSACHVLKALSSAAPLSLLFTFTLKIHLSFNPSCLVQEEKKRCEHIYSRQGTTQRNKTAFAEKLLLQR